MHACGEDTLYSLARYHGIEERPDSIVGGDDYFDMRSKVMCGAGYEDVEFGVVGAVQQQAVLHNEVGQEFVCGEASRRRIDHTPFGASADDERIQRFALRVGGSVGRAFTCEPDAETLRESPYVEQHTTQGEELEALAKRSLAARSLCHGASLRGNRWIGASRRLERHSRKHARTPAMSRDCRHLRLD
jgi:hypothetical protein